jgi:hypothetical protein
MKVREKTVSSDRLYAAWNGEWSRFSNQTSQIIPVQHDTSKMVYIPEDASELEIRFTYDPWNTDEKRFASLFATIDWDGDGRTDFTQTGSPLEDARFSTMSLDGLPTGHYWSFNVEGTGIDWNLGERFRETQYKEVRVEFTMSLNITFGQGEHVIPMQDPHAQFAYWKPFGEPVEGVHINLSEHYFDLGEVKDPSAVPIEDEEGGGSNLLWYLLLFLMVGGTGTVAYVKREQLKARLTGRKKPEMARLKDEALPASDVHKPDLPVTSDGTSLPPAKAEASA